MGTLGYRGILAVQGTVFVIHIFIEYRRVVFVYAFERPTLSRP